MVKYAKLLYGFVASLGIVFLSPLFSAILQGGINTAIVMMVFFLSIVGTVFLISGICGIGSQYLRNSQNFSALQLKLAGDSKKHSTLYGFITVLGTVFLVAFFAVGYWSGHSVEVSGFFQSIPLAGFLMFFVFLFGGTSLLTVGICGIARQYFMSYQNLFTILVAILIPSLILMPLGYLWVGAMTVNF